MIMMMINHIIGAKYQFSTIKRQRLARKGISFEIVFIQSTLIRSLISIGSLTTIGSMKSILVSKSMLN